MSDRARLFRVCLDDGRKTLYVQAKSMDHVVNSMWGVRSVADYVEAPVAGTPGPEKRLFEMSIRNPTRGLGTFAVWATTMSAALALVRQEFDADFTSVVECDTIDRDVVVLE